MTLGESKDGPVSGRNLLLASAQASPSGAAGDILCCEIPAGIDTKARLLEVLGQGLQFPGWTARNWDAFSDAIRDLSWLKHREVWLLHADVPFSFGRKSRRVYLEILAEALESWSRESPPKLRASFPENTVPALSAALAE